MGFLDTLLGRPTLDSVVRDVTRELQAFGAADLQFDPALSELAFSLQGAQTRMYLGNLLGDLRRARRTERAAVLRRYMDSLLAADAGMPARYAEARPLLMPVVRRREDIGIAMLTARAGWHETTARFVPATGPLVDDLVIALVVDRPTSMAYVNEQELPKWEVSFEQALADALDNLRGSPEHGGWKPLGQGVWSGEWGDDYDSSRILLPDLIHRVGVRDPVVSLPFRNVLMLTDAGNHAGIALMAKACQDYAGDHQRGLAPSLLRLDGARWVPHAPPVAQSAWRLLHLRNEATLHDTQKELLDAMHQRTYTDVFVASYTLVTFRPDTPRSFAVWADGVDTLLPHTDLIAFSHRRHGKPQTLLVPWADACGVVGDLMVPTDEMPARTRVRAFPDAVQLERLASLVFQPG